MIQIQFYKKGKRDDQPIFISEHFYQNRVIFDGNRAISDPNRAVFDQNQTRFVRNFQLLFFETKMSVLKNWYRIFDLRKSPYLNFFQGPLKIISDATQPNFEVWNGDWNLKFCICIGITIKGTHQGLNLEY